jgi:hypothetical protein
MTALVLDIVSIIDLINLAKGGELAFQNQALVRLTVRQTLASCALDGKVRTFPIVDEGKRAQNPSAGF